MVTTRRLAALTGTVALLLTGCSVFEREPSEPKVVESEEPAIVDDVTAVLAPLVEEEGELPTSESLFDTLMDAGYDAGQLEATQDKTPLDNGVSSKMFAVLLEEGCIVGEIREGDIFASLMPPSESTGTCLYGAVDRPEDAPEPSGEPREDGAGDNGAGHIPGEDFSGESADDGEESGGAEDSSDSGSSGSEDGSDGGSGGDSSGDSSDEGSSSDSSGEDSSDGGSSDGGAEEGSDSGAEGGSGDDSGGAGLGGN